MLLGGTRCGEMSGVTRLVRHDVEYLVKALPGAKGAASWGLF